MATRSMRQGRPTTPDPAAPAAAGPVRSDAADAAAPQAAASSGPADAASRQPIPGASVMGHGIHIKPRQPYELKRFLFDVPQEPTGVHLCCDTGQQYAVPPYCGVNDSPPAPSDQSLGETIIEESWDRFGNELTVNAKAAVSSNLITIDPTAFHASNVRSEADSYYALKSSFIAFWSLFMTSAPGIPALDADVERLPEDPLASSSRAAYARIFETYGSHYVKTAWVGGKASLVFIVAKSLQFTREEIRASIQAAVGGIASGSASGERKAIDDRFRSNSTCKVFGSGGDRIELAKLSSLDQEAFTKWIESVKTNPQVIQLGLAGIWTLVKNEAKAQALKTAYIEESSFRPLTAIIPVTTPSKSSMYFVKNDDVFEYRLHPSTDRKVTRNPEFAVELKRKLGSNPALANFARPDAAISLNGFGRGRDDAIYLFKHRQYLRLDLAPAPVTVHEGYPKDLGETWPEVDFDRIDAALTVAPDRIYLFRGARYIRLDFGPSGTVSVGARDLIKKRWTGVTFDRLDTAVYWGNSKVYFFYEDQYIRYDMSVLRADPGYPRFIESNYIEDWEVFG